MTQRHMTKRIVTLLGGTGFVGTELTYRLAEEFDEVRLLTRRLQRVRAQKVLPNVNIIQASVHDEQELAKAIAGSDVVINLVGILNESGKRSANSFEGAHADLTRKVVDACVNQGVPRYLHMSALNADAQNGSSVYLKTKGVAEGHVKAASEKLASTIFQPSVIFGATDAFFNRFSDILRIAPVLPLACPDSKMAPVYVDDVCKVMIDSIDDPDAIGASLCLCGPADYTLKELVNFTAESAGMQRVVIGLPDWAARLQARVMELVPGKPFTRDNYLSLQTDSVCSTDCVRQPTSIQAIVPRYLGTSDINGRMQTRRQWARRS